MTGSGPDQAQDRVAAIYERYASHIAAYALRRSSGCDAADTVAETFLVVWRRRDVVPEEPQTLPWLYGVARRVLSNQRRSSRRQGRLWKRLASEFAALEVSVPPLEEIEELRRVAAALEHLSEDDAELLRLTAWEALTPSEIATVFDIAPGTARQRLSRARQRLRKQLAAADADSHRPATNDLGPERSHRSSLDGGRTGSPKGSAGHQGPSVVGTVGGGLTR